MPEYSTTASDGLLSAHEQAADLLLNPSARLPIALCLDVSGSMEGAPIQELNRGVTELFDQLRADPIAASSAEVAIVTFSCQPQLELDFASLARIARPPQLFASGSTDLGGGVMLALQTLNRRIDLYRQAGVDAYPPWLILMTDGVPTSTSHLEAACHVVERERQGRLTVFPIGVGRLADLELLAQFSRRRPPMKLKGLQFTSFFAWLSRSVVRVSQSCPGTSVPLDTSGLSGWAEL
jgi:uncharacterized protein YegL